LRKLFNDLRANCLALVSDLSPIVITFAFSLLYVPTTDALVVAAEVSTADPDVVTAVLLTALDVSAAGPPDPVDSDDMPFKCGLAAVLPVPLEVLCAARIPFNDVEAVAK
jgi:hypothetical protein